MIENDESDPVSHSIDLHYGIRVSLSGDLSIPSGLAEA